MESIMKPQPYTYNTTVIKPVTPAIAKQLLSNQCIDLQRAMKSAKVTGIKTAILSNSFVPTTAISIAVYPNGTEKLADGQHRLQALVDLNINISMSLMYWNVCDDAGFGALISHMDQGLKRTDSDQLKATGVNLKMQSLYGLTSADTKALATAISPITADFEYSRKKALTLDFNGTVNQMFQYAPMHKDYKELIKNAKVNLKHNKTVTSLSSANVLPVALVTLAKHPAMAGEFWSKVAGNTISKSSRTSNAPIRFTEWLMNYKDGLESSGDNGGDGQRYIVNTVAINCWNAYHDNKNITVTALKQYAKSSKDVTPVVK
jgi:hypothetical protein